MKLQDDRTAAEKRTHTCLAVGTDPGMSGWGRARGGTSYAAWACLPNDIRDCLCWVERRGDMKRVRLASGNWRPRGIGHAHIYVWDRIPRI